MAPLVVLALVAAVTVLLHVHSGRRLRTDRYWAPAPFGGLPQDRDRERLMAELRALGASDLSRHLN
jgi:hypothetical protein